MTPASALRRPGVLTFLLVSACASSPAPSAPAAEAPAKAITCERQAPAGTEGPANSCARSAHAAPKAPAAAPVTTPPDPWLRDASTAELERRAAALVDATEDNSPVFTRDGKQVVFVSDRTGLSQLFIASLAGGGARRLTDWPERMESPVLTRDDRAVIFTSDHGGDEQWRLYRADLATGKVETLTPEPLNRDLAQLPRDRPDTLFFSARAMSEARSQIYAVSSRGAGPAKAVYADEGAGFLVDVSRDGKRGLFIRFRTHQDTPLVLVDLESGKARPLYPRQGAATVRDAAFSADGRTVFLATDGGGEQALVLGLDAATGEERLRYAEARLPTATAEQLAVSPRGDRVALALDAGNHTEVRLLDARTLALSARPELPLGHGYLGPFSEDGARLPLVWTTPAHPRALFSLAIAGGAPTRIATGGGAEQATPIDVSLQEVTSFDGLRIPVNVYLPRGATGPLPVLVSLHGGPAGASTIKWSPQARLMLSLGYAWVEPNIRGSGGFGRSFEKADDGARRVDSFRDVDAVRQWLATQPWADSRRLVVLGGSFGGYLVLNELTSHPDVWRAGVDLFGIADLPSFMATTKGLVRENYLHELGDPAKDGALLAQLSPLRQVDRIAAPLLVYTGANDPRVPRAQSDLIVQALRGRGVPVEYMVALDEGHGAERRETQIELQVRIARFLERALASSAPSAQRRP